MLIVEHYSMDVSEVCSLLNEFEDTGRVMQLGKKSYFRHQWKTLNYPVCVVPVEFGKKYRLRYLEYDYIGHQFYVEASEI